MAPANGLRIWAQRSQSRRDCYLSRNSIFRQLSWHRVVHAPGLESWRFFEKQGVSSMDEEMNQDLDLTMEDFGNMEDDHSLQSMPQMESHPQQSYTSSIQFNAYANQGFIPNQPHLKVQDYPPEKRVTIWNKFERRKISGNAAPMGKNLLSYLAKHPECEVFDGQDKQTPMPTQMTPGLFSVCPTPDMMPQHMSSVNQIPVFTNTNTLGIHNHVVMRMPCAETTEKRVTIWHKDEKRKISGNAAPMEKNVKSYLATHPNCEIYIDQDKPESERVKPTEPVLIPEEEPNRPPFAETQLTPVESFGYEPQFQDSRPDTSGAIAITSPMAFVPIANSHQMGVSPMSPVDSISSSFTMDFSVGSYGRHPWNRGAGAGSYHQPNMLDPRANDGRMAAPMDVDRRNSQDGRTRSSTFEDYGVMGRPEGL